MYGDMALADIPATQLGDFSVGGLPPQFASVNDLMSQANYYGPYLPNRRGGGLIPMMQAGGMALPEEMMLGTPRPRATMGADIRGGAGGAPAIPPPMASPMSAPLPSTMGASLGPVGGGPPALISPIASPMSAPLPSTMGANIGMGSRMEGMPQQGGIQNLTPDLSGTDFSALQGLSGTDIVFGSEPIFGSDTDFSMSGSNVFGTGAGTGAGTGGGAGTGTGTGTGTGAGAGTGATGTAGQIGGYGSAIGARTALSQMGMGDVATDPRLQEYLKDLPQFSQGYRQQFGDIQKGGRQALQQAYAQQRLAGAGGGGGFAGAGAGAQAFQQQLGGLHSGVAQKRRGVVEGFQSDLLSAIGDIEAKGEFEFGTSGGFDPVADIMSKNPSLTKEEAEEMHAKNVDAYYGQQYG